MFGKKNAAKKSLIFRLILRVAIFTLAYLIFMCNLR